MRIETHQRRSERLREAMRADGLAALLVTDGLDVRYLSGFSGEDASLLLAPTETILLTDSRFRLQAQEECPQLRLLEPQEKLSKTVPELLKDVEGVVGLEAEYLTVAQWEAFQKEAPRSDMYRAVEGLVADLRKVKDEEEIAVMRRAGELAVRALEHLTEMQVVGRTELDVALELEFWVRSRGADGIAFPFIVAFGPRAAMPHATPQAEVIGPNGLLVVDLGARVEGYASDITRTFATGPLSARELELYEVVRQAQAQAKGAIRPGMSGSEADGLARRVIQAAGLGELFGHSLGHGVGLNVHEGPRVGPRSEDILEAGNVVTVEPGAYQAGVGGVRIEDTVVVREGGVEVLTETGRDLVQLA